MTGSKKDTFKYLEQLTILRHAFSACSASPLSCERRLNIINLLSALCECENTDVLSLLDKRPIDVVEKHVSNPKVKAFFVIAQGHSPRGTLTSSEREIVLWAMSEALKHKALLTPD